MCAPSGGYWNIGQGFPPFGCCEELIQGHPDLGTELGTNWERNAPEQARELCIKVPVND